ncbi:MAG TPA: hypothetical protein EYP56_14345 [Planctomycetaceae bacterium]|nr:hypothetical protein [Planctomycetaceae bacterium]
MDGLERLSGLTLCAGLLVAATAGCAWLNRPSPWTPPPVFTAQPTLEQVIAAVNANSSRIQSFATERATLSGPGIPTLRASIVFQRPRRFRLRGETGLSGPELDVGSNDELFWIWIRRSQPKALYHCRHDQFAASPVRQSLPIQPDWLIQALGVVEFDPALPHQGPFPLPTADSRWPSRGSASSTPTCT